MQHTEPPDEGSVAWWLRFADSDLALAQLRSEDVMIELYCFHAQQAAEKAIKAVLRYFNEPVPRTHSIEGLLEKASKKIDVPMTIRSASKLTDYASTTRYPGEYEPITDNEYSEALEKAEKVVAWAKHIWLERK